MRHRELTRTQGHREVLPPFGSTSSAHEDLFRALVPQGFPALSSPDFMLCSSRSATWHNLIVGESLNYSTRNQPATLCVVSSRDWLRSCFSQSSEEVNTWHFSSPYSML